MFFFVYYRLMLHGTIFLSFFRVGSLHWHIFLEKWRRSPTIMGAVYVLFSALYNDLLHVSGHSPADKIE